MSYTNEISTPKLGDFAMPDPEDQQVWNASLGLDLADRSVFEAEVLIWRIVRERSSHSGNPDIGYSDLSNSDTGY
jgi:hypothetical protein